MLQFTDDVQIYDLESYPNIFTACFVEPSNPDIFAVYEISDRKNDTEALINHLRKIKMKKVKMVGFNNVGFDYQLIHSILEKAKIAKQTGTKVELNARSIYGETCKLIEGMKNAHFGGGSNLIREKDFILPQVDLFKIHHFDNKARATSLKMLEFNMRSENIEDLPFPVGKVLSNEEMDVLIHYNKHDVAETLKFYNYSKDAIDLRTKLTEQFGFDCTNFNDTKIGKELFIRTLESEKAGTCYTMTDRGRVMNQTIRSKIEIKDCLFSYINFDRNRPEFKAVHEWLKAQTINETKGVFSDLLEHEIGDVAKYAQMVTKRKKLSDPDDTKNKKYVPSEERIAELEAEYPMGWIETKELKSPKGAISYYWCYNIAETLNVVINGFRYDFGVGGIHGAKQGIHKSTEKRKLRTLDVASYYPNMAISNKVYPAHLGLTFCKVYEDLYNQRKSYDKKHPANAAYKLALNGTYGLDY